MSDITRLAREQRGSTLIELLVTSLLLVAVVGAVLALYRVAAVEQDRVEGGVRGLVDQQIGLERLSRELRQATQLCAPYPTCGSTFTGAQTIDFERCFASGSGTCTLKWVRYDCTGSPPQSVPPDVTTRACLRSEAATPGGLGSNQVPVIKNLAATPTGVFSATSPNYLTFGTRVQAKGFNNPISLDDGIRFRNSNDIVDSGESGS
jgi:hypothetical protein